MVLIRFSDPESKRKALGFLGGRFSFKSWATGEVAIPESALPYLALENIPLSVGGQATYERLVPAVRSTPAANA